jgi:predicted N-acetyltransferase YhbS
VFDTFSGMTQGWRRRVITIRPECPDDHEAVFEVNHAAFGGESEADVSGGDGKTVCKRLYIASRTKLKTSWTARNEAALVRRTEGAA